MSTVVWTSASISPDYLPDFSWRTWRPTILLGGTGNATRSAPPTYEDAISPRTDNRAVLDLPSLEARLEQLKVRTPPLPSNDARGSGVRHLCRFLGYVLHWDYAHVHPSKISPYRYPMRLRKRDRSIYKHCARSLHPLNKQKQFYFPKLAERMILEFIHRPAIALGIPIQVVERMIVRYFDTAKVERWHYLRDLYQWEGKEGLTMKICEDGLCVVNQITNSYDRLPMRRALREGLEEAAKKYLGVNYPLIMAPYITGSVVRPRWLLADGSADASS